MSCQHTEDVCQHCLEKVHTTTEDSPRGRRMNLVEKLVLFPTVTFILGAAAVSWTISTKILYRAAKIAVKLIDTTTG